MATKTQKSFTVTHQQTNYCNLL